MSDVSRWNERKTWTIRYTESSGAVYCQGRYADELMAGLNGRLNVAAPNSIVSADVVHWPGDECSASCSPATCEIKREGQQ